MPALSLASWLVDPLLAARTASPINCPLTPHCALTASRRDCSSSISSSSIFPSSGRSSWVFCTKQQWQAVDGQKWGCLQVVDWGCLVCVTVDEQTHRVHRLCRLRMQVNAIEHASSFAHEQLFPEGSALLCCAMVSMLCSVSTNVSATVAVCHHPPLRQAWPSCYRQ